MRFEEKVEKILRGGVPVVAVVGRSLRTIERMREVVERLGLKFRYLGLDLEGEVKLEEDTIYVVGEGSFSFSEGKLSPAVLEVVLRFFEERAKGSSLIVIFRDVVNLDRRIERMFMVVEEELPGELELLEIQRKIEKQEKFEFGNVVRYGKGLTELEWENALVQALLSGDVEKELKNIKGELIRRSGVLEVVEVENGIEVGGLEELKRYIKETAYIIRGRERAREFGVEVPKGCLLVGVPGTGKSLSAKYMAKEVGLPLVRFDLGRVFGSFVGESEAKVRKALSVLDAMSPVVVWMDEVEKSASGLKSSGRSDSGVTARVVGTLLTWMQEQEGSIVVATANDISQLPPEFLRAGRFDAIFFVDLPDEEERREIWKIHLEKRRRKIEDYDIERLVKASEGYVGAEIEQAVKDGLRRAFVEGRELMTEDLESAIKEIVPLGRTRKEEIEMLRRWAEERARFANKRKSLNIEEKEGERKVRR